MNNSGAENFLRAQLIELLKGGFAPNVLLLKEFDYKKSGIILDGLHFSAWTLLGHIRTRQKALSDFILDPENHNEIWEEAYWPQNYQPSTKAEWEKEIGKYEIELQEVIKVIENPETPLFKVQKNGETISGAAMILLHHTGYHIGQLKTIGRQMSIW
ncbi:MAG TPA: hypothetical protein VFM70_05335 [Salinimicrobium sp.]|nr:hypothetical protein [Salinimicrobium sp.]